MNTVVISLWRNDNNDVKCLLSNGITIATREIKSVDYGIDSDNENVWKMLSLFQTLCLGGTNTRRGVAQVSLYGESHFHHHLGINRASTAFTHESQ